MQKTIEFEYASDLHYAFTKAQPQYGGSRDIFVDIIRPNENRAVTVRLSILERIVKDGQRLQDIWRDHS